MIEFITALGAFSLSYIWIPLGLWTLMAIPVVYHLQIPGQPPPGHSLPWGHGVVIIASYRVSVDAVVGCQSEPYLRS